MWFSVVVAQPEFSPAKLQSFSWAKQHADITTGFKKNSFSVSSLKDVTITQSLRKKAYPLEQGHNKSMQISIIKN